MIDERGAELQQQLQLLAEQFIAHLHSEVPALQQLAASLPDAGTSTRETLADLRQRLHRLAGSAGTYGFEQLGQDCRNREQQTDQLLTLDSIEPEKLLRLAQAMHTLSVPQPTASQSLTSLLTPEPVPEQQDDTLLYILEADQDMADSLQNTLSNFGYRVRLFADDALLHQACLQQRPDALIVDFDHHPQLNKAAMLSNGQANLTVPLFVLTSQDDFATQLKAASAGASGFLSKPVNFSALENSLERYFRRQTDEPYRVLIIDDDHELSSRYALVLRAAGMMVEVLDNPADIHPTLMRFHPEIILLDVNMPECPGPYLAQIIRFHDELLQIAIVYVSGVVDAHRQMDALLRAGDDFITKPVSDQTLITTVFARVRRARTLANSLSRDSLTGLITHANIKEQVVLETERARRFDKVTSVVMLDIDHFKRVNDTYGHLTGDNVIRTLANMLRQRLRKIDSIGRYGGEEFALVMPQSSSADAARVIDQIREDFAKLQFQAGDETFTVTFSAGITDTSSPIESKQVLEVADRALYAAKTAGRNQVRVLLE
ncbi:diguanylate cyclase [Pokkaliibacter sp. MBI-7]|uniref:diguanylate cyclase n=1 Tax=Pokkaliibacter sp. MBI-7 TaxID=3040600 RepID=UPI00244BBD69|nr:diguanylate cyclase [Pokkaliibacter sp. MBI-7]MDH2434029.1 diguanylate cyclase [Pokkaliibacter sp. MBI-7]